MQIFDKTITARWKSETLAAGGAVEDVFQAVNITEKMVDYCFEELRDKAEAFRKTGIVTAYDGDVVKSDSIVSPELKTALKCAAVPLENVAPAQQDWHPGSDKLVLDLVHPSLFPVVYGKTRILPQPSVTLRNCIEQCGNGQTLDIPSEKDAHLEDPNAYRLDRWNYQTNQFSRNFQWLPCQIAFGHGEEVK